MGKKKVEIEPPEIYYDYIYSIAKNWTNYGIPISFIEPRSKFRVEGLIYGPKKRNRTKNKNTVKVWYMFESTFLQQPVEVDCKAILPSKRIITKMGETDEVLTTTLIPEYKEEERDPLDLMKVKLVYDYFNGINWTAPELCAILERPNSDSPLIEKLPFLGKVSKRNCRITNEILDTYGIITPEEAKNNQQTKFSMEGLYKKYENCEKCSLSDIRKKMGCKITPGRGNTTNPKVFLIGEAPGVIERDTGIAFHPEAPAGKELKRAMDEAALSQDIDCYLSNSVICWPAPKEGKMGQNGKPTDEQIGLCSSRLKMELAILKPKIIVILGATAYKTFFGTFLKGTMTANIGWKEVDGDYKVYVLYHPSYIIRQVSAERDRDKKESIKREYTEHFRIIKRELDGSGTNN